MAKVNVFVSSTCYDLSQIRNGIKRCIEEMGHNPILSELKDFPIDTSLSNSENCINAVNKEADIFVLIIGNHYGSVVEYGKSITNVEFMTAVNKGIPIYTFALKQMTNLLPVWEKNPDADYSNVVDNNKVFEFLADVRKKRGLWNFVFDNAQDITEVLKAQLSNLFHDALIIKKKVEKPTISVLFEKISSKAIDILIKKEFAYELRFFMQCMNDEIEKYTDLQHDYVLSIAHKSLFLIENNQQFKKWAIHKVRELQNITSSIERLNTAVNTVFATSNDTWELESLYYLSRTYARVYASLLEWGIEVNSTLAPDKYSKMMHSFASIPHKIINQIEKYPKDSLNKIDLWVAKQSHEATISELIKTFDFNLDVDKGDQERFMNECKKVLMN